DTPSRRAASAGFRKRTGEGTESPRWRLTVVLIGADPGAGSMTPSLESHAIGPTNRGANALMGFPTPRLALIALAALCLIPTLAAAGPRTTVPLTTWTFAKGDSRT